ncbi:diguanylate cyclase (GGDEF) domain-containing protein [Acidovorax sp. CF316]|uniref:putative bifunctional diguanylate cyclase/phosphodiesterase n=1 Tax=Acidovorax sp. CF316 TaxID=1144317 RepID=UPI00026BE774|nr:EAL domain-containing protein [Acidovorax sp. CF316]EJE52045.1 diguanylate cyclase (GGDEF) domain-containing protein [Acidovorax sp. CF316]
MSLSAPTPAARLPANRLPSGSDLAERAVRYAALEWLSRPVWVFDIDGQCVHWANTPALAVWNATTLAELCGRDMGHDMSESVARRLDQYQSDFLLRADASFNEQWTIYPGGVAVSLNVRFSGNRLPDGRMSMLCEAEPVGMVPPESLRSVEALLHTAVMITLYHPSGAALYRNPAARAAVLSPGERLQDRIGSTAAFAALSRSLDQHGVGTLTLAVRTPLGERWHELSARRCKDAVTGQEAVLVSEADISAIKHTEERANFQSLHDVLTGLPNRAHFTQRFARAMEEARAQSLEAALLLIDLDHFKDVNDTLGHAAGDELLVTMAQRLRHTRHGTEVLARWGGDEFLVLLTSPRIREDLDALHERISVALAVPLSVAGTQLRMTSSIGVALYPQDGETIEILLRNADLAMYAAKERGRNTLAYFDGRMAETVRSRTELEKELRQALERGEFEVYFQPRVDVATNTIRAVEALVRWNHPRLGLVSPAYFIPACETTGLIGELGLWVLAQAAHQQVAWVAQGWDLVVSVNLSPRQFASPDLLHDITAVLRQAGVNPARMELEITESILLGEDQHVLSVLRELSALGLTLALDDFGTGYSNLAYLQRFPVHTLKIDKTFIQDTDANRSLAELIVSLSTLMKLTAVAEGVETQEQLDWVARRGIAQYQGYLYARPMPVRAFTDWLRAHQQP